MRMDRGLLALLAALLLIAPAAVAAQHGDTDSSGDADDDREDADDRRDDNATGYDDDPDHDDDEGNETDRRDDAEDRADDARDRADDASSDRADDARELAEYAGENARREVKVVADKAHALFELEKEGNASEEEVKLDYAADEARLKLEFAREAGDDETEAESAFELDVEIEAVLEYVDDNGNGVYDPDADTLIAEHRADEDMDWTVLGVEDVTVGNKTGKKVTSEGAFHDADGAMRIVFYSFGDFAQVGEATLRPTEVKMDFIFEGYGYGHNASQLALELKTEVKAGYEVAHNAVNSTPAIEAMMGDVSGYFSWADWAMTDGNRTAVSANVFEDETKAEQDGGESEVEREQKLYLSYARGAHIVHDPVMGVSYQTQSSDTSEPTGNSTPAAGILAALGALAAVAWARRQW